MIVKIWSIKGDYAGQAGKVGGIEGLKNVAEYIMDKEKVIAKENDLKRLFMDGIDSAGLNDAFLEGNTSRVIDYMANEEKIEGKYITGYLCDPNTAVTDFNTAKLLTFAKAGKKEEKEDGAIAFHIVQSFPEGLDISDEEVHRCGVELCEKIGVHQAVICSHVHPVKDEDGEVHGKCKHNHILINAYIHPDYWDPKHPQRLKYNDCKESYAQLRVWNDEIAIDHGLPIIINPDEQRVYSWKENAEANKGLSWKERIRLDIEGARRIASSWKDFVSIMEKADYTIQERGKTLTYIAPDGEHRARGATLGRQYTKESLELFWRVREGAQKAVDEVMEDKNTSSLSDLLEASQEPLKVAVPLGAQGKENRKFYYMPLTPEIARNNSWTTYFDPEKTYDICDENNKNVSSSSGEEILRYLEELRNRELEAERRRMSAEEQELQERNQKYYTRPGYINSSTKRHYKTHLYDEHGRRRSLMELIFILAITVLSKEKGLWEPSEIPKGQENDALFAPTNWKIQSMIDSLYIARQEDIQTPKELQDRVHEAGAALSRARSAYNSTNRAKEKMDPLYKVVRQYRDTFILAEKILSMPEGKEKEQLLSLHKDDLERYKEAKHRLHAYKIETEEQIVDFEQRYDKIQKDLTELKDRFDETKEEYRKLKKLQYNTELAQYEQYCYGPEYTYDKAYAMDMVPEQEKTKTPDKAQAQDGKPQAARQEPDEKDKNKDKDPSL